MKIAIYGQYFEQSSAKCLNEVISILAENNVIVVFEAAYLEMVKKVIPLKVAYATFETYLDINDSFDYFISIGGDGTILRAITYIRDSGIPILGVNTGRLGFLATVKRDEVTKAFQELFQKKYTLVDRGLLKITIKENAAAFNELNFALNEVTVSRKNTTSMIRVATYLNGEYLTSYWADGLIVSTPTGSTGYSLSCGGPVIAPDANSFVLTPIAPHNLNARPLVIPDDTEIKLVVSGREETHLVSLDSRIASVENETEIQIQKSDFTVKMVEFNSEPFFKTLRNKLLWGEDKRN